MSLGQSKYDDESLVTGRVEGRWLKVWYAKVTVVSWTISVRIEPVHWTACQHAWLVATQIGLGNQNVINNLFK